MKWKGGGKIKVNDIPDVVRKKLETNYKFIDRLGGGMSSQVYFLQHKYIDKECALKVMSVDYILDTLSRSGGNYTEKFNERKKRFIKEAKLYKKINHPNIAKIYEIDVIKDEKKDVEIPYILMQYVEGETLKYIIESESKKPLSLKRVIEISENILNAFEEIHQRGIVHRDIKPANIMIEKAGGKAILVDFGIARDLIDDTTLTATGEILGSPAYMAPEQFEGGKKVTSKADIYAFGVILYEMLAGERPFEGTHPLELMYAHRNEPVPDLKKKKPQLPPGLSELIRKAMAKNQKERGNISHYQSIFEGLKREIIDDKELEEEIPGVHFTKLNFRKISLYAAAIILTVFSYLFVKNYLENPGVVASVQKEQRAGNVQIQETTPDEKEKTKTQTEPLISEEEGSRTVSKKGKEIKDTGKKEIKEPDPGSKISSSLKETIEQENKKPEVTEEKSEKKSLMGKQKDAPEQSQAGEISNNKKQGEGKKEDKKEKANTNEFSDYRNQPTHVNLNISEDLNQKLKTLVKQKVNEYMKNKPNDSKIKERETQLRETFDKYKTKKENEFASRYQEIFDVLNLLRETGYNLGENKRRIEGIIVNILTLNQQINNLLNLMTISEGIYKQRLASVPGYFLLLGEKVKGYEPRVTVIENIKEDMRAYLRDKWLIFEFKNATSFRGNRIKEETIIPDDREGSFVRNNVIYTYQVFKHYPFYIHANNNLNNVYGKLVEIEDFEGDTLDFKIDNSTSRYSNIKYIDFNSVTDPKVEMLKFFNQLDPPGKTNLKYDNLISSLLKDEKESLKKIGKISDEYRNKRKKYLLSLKGQRVRKEKIIEALKNLNDLQQSFDNFATILKKKSFEELHAREKLKIKEIAKNLRTELDTMIKYLKDHEHVTLDKNVIIWYINTLFGAADEISKTAKNELKKLLMNREFVYLEMGKVLEDPHLSIIENFEKAALVAFENLKNKKISSSADIIDIDKNGNIIRRKESSFYKGMKTLNINKPLFYKKIKIAEEPREEYVVYLMATAVYNCEIDDNTTSDREENFDFNTNLIWIKDSGKFVVFEEIASDISLVSLLKEKKKQNKNWRVPTKKDFESLLNNKEIFKRGHLFFNRFYWSSGKKEGYYRVYKFV